MPYDLSYDRYVPKVQSCVSGAVYNDRAYAEKCAQELSGKTGKKFQVETGYEDIGGEFRQAARRIYHHRVVRGTVGAKKAAPAKEDFWPRFVCEDVYEFRGEKAERCKKFFQGPLTKSEPAAEKMKGCKPGQIYMGGIFSNGKEMAEKCARQLSKETGKKFWVETERENISDGLPPRVKTTHHHVREEIAPASKPVGGFNVPPLKRGGTNIW